MSEIEELRAALEPLAGDRIESAKTAMYGLSMLSLGIAFGAWWVATVARKAYISGRSNDLQFSPVADPEWVAPVHSLTKVALLTFLLFLIGMLAIDNFYGGASSDE